MADFAETTVGRVLGKCIARHALTVGGLLIAGGIGWNNLQRDVGYVEAASRANTEAIQSLDTRLDSIERKQDVQSEKMDAIQRSMKEERVRDTESRQDIKDRLKQILDQLNGARR